MKKKNQDYLVRFTYDFYCQGYEDAVETLLVRNVPSFEAACNRVKIQELGLMRKYHNARDFENMTIDLEDVE